MAALPPPRGLIVDLITPLKKSGQIDGRGLGRHLDRILPHAQALVLASPHLGEGKNLAPEQREELLEKALVVVRGRVPLLVWMTQSTEEETRQTLHLLKKRLARRKYAGPVFWVDTPLCYHSNRGLPLYYQEMSATVQEPFLLYNDPELIAQIASTFKRTNIRTAVLKEISRIERVQGLIFLGSLERARNYQKAVRSRTHFRIYDGDETHFLTHPSLSGIVSAGANLAPRAWQKVTAASLGLTGNGEVYPDQLRQIWQLGEYLRNLREIYQTNPVPPIKEVLYRKGLIEEPASTLEDESAAGRAGQLEGLMEQCGDNP